MKTSININLFGTIYAIDEDAHRLLDQYLSNLKSYFSKQEGGDEITDDIEHRVAELFWELKQKGTESISIEQVTEIMHKIGNPEEMSNQPGEETKHTETTTEESTQEGQQAYEAPRTENNQQGPRRFYRDGQDKILGGVLSGLCHYFGWTEPLLLRILFILLCLFTEGIFVFLYILLWIIAPKAITAEQRLMMQGKAVNPETIKSEVLNGAATGQNVANNNHSGCLKGILAVLLAPFGCLGIFVLFILAIVFFSLVMGMFGVFAGGLFGGSAAISELLVNERGSLILVILCIIAAIALPIYGLYRWFRRDSRPMSSTTAIILAGCWLIAILFGWFKGYDLKQKFANIDWANINLDWDKFDHNDWDADNDSIDNASLANGELVSVNDFQSILFSGVGEVIFLQDSICSVEVSGNDWLKSHTLISSEEGKLKIELDDQAHNTKINSNLTVMVHAPYLTNISVEGVGGFKVNNELTQDQPLLLAMKGVGKIKTKKITCPKVTAIQEGVGVSEINVDTDSLIVDCKGVGKMKMKGKTRNYQRNSEDLVARINDSELKIGE